MLLVAAMGCSVMGWAQKTAIRTAESYLIDEEYERARTAIDGAVTHESTAADPKAWLVRGRVYLALQQNDTASRNAFAEAARSFMKVAELKPDFERREVNNYLLMTGQYYYNESVRAYQAQQYDQAYKLGKEANNIFGLENGNRLRDPKRPVIDTVITQSEIITAYSAYHGKKYNEALPMLLKLKENPIAREPFLYSVLADVYQQQNQNDKWIAILEEGRKVYPNDENLRNAELNYYIKLGKQDELLKKLEDAATTDPNNVELVYGLANTYNNMAFPKDKDGKDLAKPANFDALLAKAEGYYAKAAQLAPDRTDVSYNFATVYFNQAADLDRQINAITDNSAAGLKKVEALEKQRNAMFEKALPYLEKTFQTLDARAASLSADDKLTYTSTMQALRSIYLKTRQIDKATAIKKKMDAAR